MNLQGRSSGISAIPRVAAGVVAVVIASTACAQTSRDTTPYPARSIRLIVPQSAGGSTDLAARGIAQKLSDALHQPIVVDNRPGAGSVVGTDITAKATPDGYTLLVVAASFTSSPSLYKKLPYDAVRDFAGVTQLAALPHVLLVQPSLPAKSVADLIALAKAKPGQLNYATGGVASASDMATHLFMHMTGTRMVNVPYKGGAPALTAMLGGECHLNLATISNALPHAKSGKLRALGVSTLKRSIAVPELPTIAEAGVPGYDFSSWIGLLAPAKTPKPVVAKLSSETAKVVQSAEVKNALLRDGLEAAGTSPGEFDMLIRSEVAKWAQVVKAAKIEVQ